MGDLNDLAIFAQVVDHKSFTVAARQLRLSPSAVSKHIGRLEEKLGVPLFNRSTRQLTLTEFGQHLYQRCSRALLELEEAQTIVKDMNRGLKGRLRIHAIPGVGQRVVEPLLIEFINQHPDLSLDFTMSTDLVNPVEQGFDLTFRSGSPDDGLMAHSSLGCCEYGPLRYLICASPAYMQRHGVPASPHELVHHNCLIHVVQASSRQWWFNGPEGEYSVPVSGSIVANSHTTIYEAVIQGVGIARLLSYEAGEARNLGKLKILFAAATRSNRVIRAIYARTSHMPDKVALLLEFLGKRLEQPAVGNVNTP